MTVLDKVEGWNEEQWAGSKFAASMWIYTNAVLCDGWVIEDFLWEHEWVPEPNVLWKENDILEAFDYDIDAPCQLQRGLLWFSAPSNLNRKFVNNGTKAAKFRDTVNSAIELA